jgi:23S rRNA pseudouridine2605 synthase
MFESEFPSSSESENTPENTAETLDAEIAPESVTESAPEAATESDGAITGERVQKILARAGIASRRKAEELITEGSVTINGKIAQLGDRAVFGKDSIKVNGKLIHRVEAPIYLNFYKPKNVISSLSDPEGRPTIGDYLKRIEERVYPVGRLDFTCEGLILLTNDGAMAEQLQKREDIPRFYHVKVKGHPDREMISRLEKGAKLENRYVKPHSVRVLKTLTNKAIVEVVILGGGQIDLKTFFEGKGFLVERISRVGYGHLSLKGMSPGEFDRLAPTSVEALLKQPELGMKALEQELELHREREGRREEREARGERLSDNRAVRARPRFEGPVPAGASVVVPRPRKDSTDEEIQSRDRFNAEEGSRGGNGGGFGHDRERRGFGGGARFGGGGFNRGPRRDDDRPARGGFGGERSFGGSGFNRGPRRDDDLPARGGFGGERSFGGGGFNRGPRRDDDRPARGGFGGERSFGGGGGEQRSFRPKFGSNVSLPKPILDGARPARTGVRRLIKTRRAED